jgi:hypothetical protein
MKGYSVSWKELLEIVGNNMCVMLKAKITAFKRTGCNARNELRMKMLMSVRPVELKLFRRLKQLQPRPSSF